MGLLKTAVIGAAIYGAYKYATQRDETGKTRFDNWKEEAPKWKKKAEEYGEKLRRQATDTTTTL